MSPFEHFFPALFFPCFSALTFYVYHSMYLTECHFTPVSAPTLQSTVAPLRGGNTGGFSYIFPRLSFVFEGVVGEKRIT
jgi:hypothetical protein